MAVGLEVDRETETLRGAPSSLRRNVSWTFLGNLVYAGCNWMTLTVLAKLGSAEMIGTYALGIAVTQPVMMFAQLNLRSVQATDSRRQYRFADYLGLRLACTAAALAVVSGFAHFGEHRPETKAVILVVGLAFGFDAISDVFYGLLQQRERMDRIAISLAARGLLSVAFLALGVVVTGSIVWGVLGQALAWALVLIGFDVPNGLRMLRSHPEAASSAVPGREACPALARLARLGWLTLPMGVTMLLVGLNTNIPRYFIEAQHGEHALGIFAAMSSLVGTGRVIVNALGQSASARLARFFALEDRPAFIGLLKKLLVLGAVLGASAPLVALVAGQQVLTILYRPEYAHESAAFVLLLSAGGIGYLATFAGYGITAARCFRIQVAWSAAVLLTSTATAWWLVPGSGTYGAAMSALLTSLVQLAIGMTILFRVLRAPKGDTPGCERAA